MKLFILHAYMHVYVGIYGEWRIYSVLNSISTQSSIASSAVGTSAHMSKGAGKASAAMPTAVMMAHK